MMLVDKIHKAFSINAPIIFEMPSHQDIGIVADMVGTLLGDNKIDFDTNGWKVVEVADYWHNNVKRREFDIFAPKDRAAVEGISERGICILKNGLEPNIRIQFT